MKQLNQRNEWLDDIVLDVKMWGMVVARLASLAAALRGCPAKKMI